MIATIVSFN